MTLSTRCPVAVLLSLAASASFGSEPCKFTAERSAGLDLTGVERVQILAGAGDLRVSGGSSAKRIEARGHACATSQAFLDDTNLVIERNGSTAVIRTDIPKHDDGDYASIDVRIDLPANLPVDAIDSSGDAELRGLKSLTMQDSSGDLRIDDIAELAQVRDSSGELSIANAGSVKLEDSSGDIDVRDVTRDVEITSDSSGEIRIRTVGGKVHIEQDSSGDIRVLQVKGSVSVESDSSGGITVADVGGDFTVSNDGSGGVRYDNVTGRVSVPQ
jgi:hypothetical protein